METLSLPAWSAALPLADLHHWHGHSGGGSADPTTAAFVTALFVAAGIGVFASILGGSLLIAFTTRIGNMFWAVPGLNVVLYAVFLLLRQYPGGFAQQFQGEDLAYTLISLLLLLILTLILTSLLALVRFVVRSVRPTAKSRSERQTLYPPQA
ncbi:MAG: hypothetical protein ACE15C_08935 [Phycisphaerae bacterium]